MNDHVVDGTELKDYLQSQYDHHTKDINYINDLAPYEPIRKTKSDRLKHKYSILAKKFKVVIDLHD